MKKTIYTPGSSQPVVEWEVNIDKAMAEIEDGLRRGLARFAALIVEIAQDDGNYKNRVGNLRRMITPNYKFVETNIDSYPSTPVTALMTDEKDSMENRKLYSPPAEFDEPTVWLNGDEIGAMVAAVMPYAQAVESRGYDVLTSAIVRCISNGVAEQLFGVEIAKAMRVLDTNQAELGNVPF